MAFHVTVKGGADDGRSFRVDGQAIVGRGPRCQIQLTDQSVAWEHAALQDQNGRLFVQSLSAAGIKQRGRSLVGEARLVDGDELEVCATTTLSVEERIGSERSGLVAPITVALAVLAVVAVAIGALVMLRPKAPAAPPFGLANYRLAYTRLDERIAQWVAAGRFPVEAGTLFRDAWRLEMAYNEAGALERYEALSSALLTLEMPTINSEANTIAEGASLRPDALHAVLDWPERVYEFNAELRSDEAMADALVWFARQRSEDLRNTLERR